MPTLQKISPCLWFNKEAEEAAAFYTSIFKNSRIVGVTRYSDVGHEIHGREPGSVMTVVFELDGQAFTGLNGGPMFQFTEAISFQVNCDTQEEIDYYWNKLGDGGDPDAQQCGWLKDRFGVSWQVVPSMLDDWISDPDSPKCRRAMEALLSMKKLDIRGIKSAYDG